MPGNRKSIRLKKYDYSQKGAYFVTVCTNNRKCIFGDVKNGEMVLNDAGEMIQRVWCEIPKYYEGIDIDYFQIMPNHIHGIIMIVEKNENGNVVGANLCVRPDNGGNINDIGFDKGRTYIKGQTHRSAPTPAIGNIIQWFKTMSTNEYIKNVKNNNWTFFKTRFWQRNFYEHII